jgi:hypothetical protein
MGYRRAWLTAGRAFRIIQLAKLHEIDRLNDVSMNMAHPEAWAEAEEKRRTYWLAYCLDRFLNISEEWPLSLHEEAVSNNSLFIFFYRILRATLTSSSALRISPRIGVRFPTQQTSHYGLLI